MAENRLIQISKRTGSIERVKDGEVPVIELHLNDGEYVANVELRQRWIPHTRKTVDWEWTAYVVTPL